MPPKPIKRAALVAKAFRKTVDSPWNLYREIPVQITPCADSVSFTSTLFLGLMVDEPQ